MAVNGEKFWARHQRRYKRYVVIPDVVISKVYCKRMCACVLAYEVDVAVWWLTTLKNGGTAYTTSRSIPCQIW